MDLIKISNLLKDASDEALARTLSNPSSGVPSYMALSELTKRQNIREKYRSQTPTTSVYEDAQMKAAPQRSVGVPMAMRGPQPQQAPQGYAQGGEVQGYAAGDYVDGGGYPIDASENTFWPSWDEIKRRTGYGRMLPPTPAAAPAAAPAMAPVVTAPNTPAAPAALPKTQGAPVMAAPRQAAPAAPAAGGISDYMNELKGYRKDLADQYQKQADVYQQQADKLESGKSKDVALALMQAGFGIMGGRSQYAAENIGQGAMPAIQQYAGMDRARQEQLQKLAMGQGALGIESLRARMEGAKTEAGLGLTEREVGAKERTARAHEISAGASASQAGAYRQAANEARIIGLREKAIEALSKDQNFQFLNPQQQEAAIQRRMQLIGIPGAGGAPAAPAIAGTYNLKTGKIE